MKRLFFVLAAAALLLAGCDLLTDPSKGGASGPKTYSCPDGVSGYLVLTLESAGTFTFKSGSNTFNSGSWSASGSDYVLHGATEGLLTLSSGGAKYFPMASVTTYYFEMGAGATSSSGGLVGGGGLTGGGGGGGGGGGASASASISWTGGGTTQTGSTYSISKMVGTGYKRLILSTNGAGGPGVGFNITINFKDAAWALLWDGNPHTFISSDFQLIAVNSVLSGAYLGWSDPPTGSPITGSLSVRGSVSGSTYTLTTFSTSSDFAFTSDNYVNYGFGSGTNTPQNTGNANIVISITTAGRVN